MSGSAIVMMIVGLAIVWGGLGLSIMHAMKVAKQKS